MDILSNFSESLSAFISDYHFTPESFSKAIGIDCSVIYKYQRKVILPTLPNLIKIADYFQCSVDFLLGLSPVNPNTKYKSAPPFNICFQKILEEHKLNRYRFLKQIHFAKQSVDDWYNGKRFPTVENAIKIAKHFDCSLDYLLCRE